MSLLKNKKYAVKAAAKRKRQQGAAIEWEAKLKKWTIDPNKRICFLDGSCINNVNGKAVGHGPGGAAAVYYPDYFKSKYEQKVMGLPDTTNNVMELSAFECGIQLFISLFGKQDEKDKEWIFLTDSQYAYHQLEEKQRATANVELIQRLVKLKQHTKEKMNLKVISIYQLPGHSKLKGNETADELASKEAEKWKRKVHRHDSSDDDETNTLTKSAKKQKLAK